MNLPFVNTRRERWARLNDYVEKSTRNNLSSFAKDELIEFSILYRQASGDLALAKTLKLPADLLDFLNDLVGRAYHQLYRSESSKLQQFVNLITVEYPSLIRQNGLIILFSLGLMLLGWLFGFFGYFVGPQVVHSFIPEGFAKQLLTEFEKNNWFNDPLVERPFISAMIMFNNIKVAVTAFAGGMLLGTLTVYIIIFNGLLLGVLSAAFMKHHHLLSFWAMILPHGVIELTAIGLSAAAGFLLARTILFPGEYSRSDALKIHGTAAVKLMLGTAGLLVIAGLIEGFFSTITTKVIPQWGRLGFAFVTTLFLIWYVRLGRKKKI